MADIEYPDPALVPAEDNRLEVMDGDDWREIPGISDLDFNRAEPPVVESQTFNGLTVAVGKEGALRITGTLAVWRPDLRPEVFLANSMANRKAVKVRLRLGADEITLRPRSSALRFTVDAPDGRLTVSGTGAAGFDLDDYDLGTYWRFGAVGSEAYYVLDGKRGGVGYLLGNGGAAPKAQAAAPADIVIPVLRSDPISARCLVAPRSAMTLPGSQASESAAGRIAFVSTDSLAFSAVAT